MYVLLTWQQDHSKRLDGCEYPQMDIKVEGWWRGFLGGLSGAADAEEVAELAEPGQGQITGNRREGGPPRCHAGACLCWCRENRVRPMRRIATPGWNGTGDVFCVLCR